MSEVPLYLRSLGERIFRWPRVVRLARVCINRPAALSARSRDLTGKIVLGVARCAVLGAERWVRGGV